MNQLPSAKSGREVSEKTPIKQTFYGKYRVFATFIICVSILIAGFAASSIWKNTESGARFFSKLESFFSKDQKGEGQIPSVTDDEDHSLSSTPDHTIVPNGAIPIVPLDLSYMDRGEAYYLNETSYQPDIKALLGRTLYIADGQVKTNEPLVLIVHTHTVESYLPDGTVYIEGTLSEATYSDDAKKNMLAVGEMLADTLNQNGIPTLQCRVTHTGENMTLQGAYSRSEESVKRYLKQYPSIRLVIDLHRDGILTDAEEYVKTEIKGGDGSLAQVMAVVGTDGNGTDCPNWEGNLALALQLRRELNLSDCGMGRPVYLRNASFNQEIAPYGLLLEIGTGGNSLEQAKRTAEKIGDALAKIIY